MNNNYTYIVSSIPALSREFKPGEGSCAPVLEWIRAQLSGDDIRKMDIVTDGFVPDRLTEDFYRKALASGNRFIRTFFAADLALRNAKAEYLNSSLGRKGGTDTIDLDAGYEDTEGKLAGIFAIEGLLERERAIDGFLWDTAENCIVLEGFTLNRVLAIVAELCIVERWLALDREAGQRLLNELVSSVRGTYGKIEFNSLK